MKKLSFGLGATALLSLGACAEGPQNNVDDFGYEGTGIEFKVAPLTLETLSDACYSFAIENATPELVVGRGPQAAAVFPQITGTAANSVCASQFGNGDGGDISYVAPCDADDGQQVHTVTLWVDALCDSASLPAVPSNGLGGICTEIQDYVNPCGTAGCELSVTCVQNADTPVEFNFTIMGQADQGFFDIAVNFDDVFCSAKLDDCNTAGEKIQLMFDTDGNRINTVVAVVACTGGPGDAVDTYLNFTTFSIQCAGDATASELTLSSVAAEGNEAIGSYPGAVYYGTEALDGVNKVYTNIAVGVGPATDCVVVWNVVPTNGPFTAVNETGVYTSYGYVNFAADNMGGTECHQYAMDGASGGVTTAYASGEAPPAGVLNTYLTEDTVDTTATFTAF